MVRTTEPYTVTQLRLQSSTHHSIEATALEATVAYAFFSVRGSILGSPAYLAFLLVPKIQMDSSQSAVLGGNGGNGTLNSQTNDTPASAAGADDSMQKLNQVSNSIQKTLGLIHQLYLTVSTFNAAFQTPLLQRINALVAELDSMVKFAEKCNIQVPMEVVNLIDDGKNPDEFTKDVINNCIAKNQMTKGKTDALKSLRKHLLEELEQNFPCEVESFRENRAAATAVRVETSGTGTKRTAKWRREVRLFSSRLFVNDESVSSNR
ncbi:Mediator of RNA polymerase II transcription subunit 10b, partial [Mucuna pruriens]